jgi:hypothetical protein
MHKAEIHFVPKSVDSLETRKEQGITEILGCGSDLLAYNRADGGGPAKNNGLVKG